MLEESSGAAVNKIGQLISVHSAKHTVFISAMPGCLYIQYSDSI